MSTQVLLKRGSLAMEDMNKVYIIVEKMFILLNVPYLI